MGQILICHRDPYFRAGLASVLCKATGDYIAVVADITEAFSLTDVEPPEVLLTELVTPSGLDGVEMFRLLQGRWPSLRAHVILCAPEKLVPSVTIPLIERGAQCVLATDAQPEEIVMVVSLLRRGLQPRYNVLAHDIQDLTEVARRGMEPCKRCGYQPRLLTPREHEVVELVSRGHSNRFIARKLHLSEATIKNHLHAAFRRLNVGNRAALVAEATRLGLIGSSVHEPVDLASLQPKGLQRLH